MAVPGQFDTQAPLNDRVGRTNLATDEMGAVLAASERHEGVLDAIGVDASELGKPFSNGTQGARRALGSSQLGCDIIDRLL